MGARPARRDELSRSRHGGGVERHLRRSRPPDGGNEFQLRRRRFLGVGRRPAIPGKILGAGHEDRRELRRLFHDSLRSQAFLQTVIMFCFTPSPLIPRSSTAIAAKDFVMKLVALIKKIDWTSSGVSG